MKRQIQERYRAYRTASVDEIISSIKDISGVEFVGRGANRAVFEYSDKVYKVPISSTGNHHNRLALQKFQRLKEMESEEYDQLVAPIVELYGNILIQKRCPKTDDLSAHQKVKSKLDQYGIEYREWNDSDVGISEGSIPVLLDIPNLQL